MKLHGSMENVFVLAALLVGTVSALRLRSTASNQGVEVVLENHNNVQYSAAFTVGGQTLPVIYDTGSFEIIVLSTLCDVCAQQHVVYDNRKSTSYSNAGGVTAEHLFGSGPVRSQKAFDTVQLGGPLFAQHMPFWQVVSHSIAVWDGSAKFSGIVGLGHRNSVPAGFGPSDSDDKTLLAQLGVQRFAVCLQRTGAAAPGKITFWPGAGVVPPGFTGLPVHGQAHWGVQMTSLRFHGVQMQDPCVPSCGAIVDSGTSLIAAPPSAKGLIDSISRLIARDCSNLNSLPVLELELGGVQIRLPPKAYVMQVIKEAPRNSSWHRVLFGGSRTSECSPGFMTISKSSSLGPVWVLGMPFLRYYHTVFDRTEKKLYIAPSQPSCNMLATSGFATPISTAAQNATQLASAGGAVSSAKVVAATFSAADFEATQMDLTGLRAPSFAQDIEDAGEKWIDL
eukprot:TRINITY_DN2401_c0_g1_i1.p1 TRINITY_DN2401_c0_g1~~TRINITY_DN2401_c0_g1_i1.p1  ORF type:complete len:474 (-),score=87.42 TRINITY_DN2401_c0_g1_i1:385-1737(-)